MKNRISLKNIEMPAYDAINGLGKYLKTTQIDVSMQELLKIRASQINSCAFCIDLHTKLALENGEIPQRIFLLNAWKEAIGHFSTEEQLALEMTEQLTLIHANGGLDEETYEKAIDQFGQQKTVQLIMVITQINAWNRIMKSINL